ncbi:hypothetical protein HaLaN_16330 [Haematococcus lacustris]|uniref:Uncharacterized protein n=1 Tax=Haematococcus lacustris TaxID=44745 RepID=A0A699ZIP5_HAELA|nr:hypothetical protein HaLaN_16330 [Haematococcus lacustris]
MGGWVRNGSLEGPEQAGSGGEGGQGEGMQRNDARCGRFASCTTSHCALKKDLKPAVVAYLKRLGMLHGAGAGLGPALSSRGAASDNGEEDAPQGDEDWRNPACEVCGRRYPHQHVKAIYSEHRHQSGDASEDDDEE